MAIDTSAKLVSSLWKSLPLPSSEESLDERLQHSTWHYTGVLAALPFPFADGMMGVRDHLLSGRGYLSGYDRVEPLKV